jgi:hypothetical protein
MTGRTRAPIDRSEYRERSREASRAWQLIEAMPVVPRARHSTRRTTRGADDRNSIGKLPTSEDDMLGDRYVVVRGDSLWRIAAKTLGGGKQWPRIWRYNNRPAVVRVTRRAIPNPDKIYVGQVLLIPRLPGEMRASGADTSTSHLATASLSDSRQGAAPKDVGAASVVTPSAHKRSLSENLKSLRSPVSFKYRLDLRWPAQDVGTAVLEVRMTGDFVLMSQKKYPATYLTLKPEIEHQITSEANHAFGKLVNDNRFIYDAKEKRLTYRSMLVSQSTTPDIPATALGVEMSSNSPIPKLRAEMRIPKLEGSYGGFLYTAIDNKLVIEITPKPQQPPPTSKAPVGATRVVLAEPSVDEQFWRRVLGAGLVVTAGVLVFGALADEWVPILGQADDVPAFGAAATVLARGLVLLGATNANLPSAKVPVHVEAKASLMGK